MWEFEALDDDSFIQMDFQDSGQLFISGSPSSSTFFDGDVQFGDMVENKPVPLSMEPAAAQEQRADPSDALISENMQLKEFFFSLKTKADQLQNVNTKLKTQLEECRGWFKTQMFSSANLKK